VTDGGAGVHFFGCWFRADLGCVDLIASSRRYKERQGRFPAHVPPPGRWPARLNQAPACFHSGGLNHQRSVHNEQKAVGGGGVEAVINEPLGDVAGVYAVLGLPLIAENVFMLISDYIRVSTKLSTTQLIIPTTHLMKFEGTLTSFPPDASASVPAYFLQSAIILCWLISAMNR